MKPGMPDLHRRGAAAEPAASAEGEAAAIGAATANVTANVTQILTAATCGRIFESMDEGFLLAEVLTDEQGRPQDLLCLQANAAAQRMVHVDLTGRRLRELDPGVDAAWLQTCARVAQRGVGERLQHQVAPLDAWFEFNVLPAGVPDPCRVAVLFQDITRRKRHDAHAALLAELSAVIERLTLPDDILQAVGERMGPYLQLADCLFADVDGETPEQLVISHCWQQPHRASLLGHWRIRDYLSPAFVCAGHAGKTLVVRNTQTDPRTLAEPHRRLQIGAFVGVPFHQDGRWRFLLSVTDAAPRDWRDDEIRLIEDLLHRLYPRLQRARAEAALQASENRYRTLVDNVRDYAIYMLDAGGFITEWPQGAQRVQGFAAHEVLGRHAALCYPPEAVDAGAPQHDLAEAAATGRAEREGWRLRKGGQPLWANEIITAVRGPGGELLGFTKITRDLSERRHAEEALKDAGRHKDEFLATLGHELRNPLAPLSNGLQIARLSARGDVALQRVIELMERQLVHLVRLVDDLLDVGRIGAGKLELRRSHVKLADVLASSAEIAGPAINRHGHHLVIETPPEDLVVDGDFDRLAQVFANLLSNAAKYTPSAGRILLRVASDDAEAVVQVADSGIGIPPEDLQHVFDLFSQVRLHQGHAEGGLGIGLALVRRLVEMHQGSVAAASAGTGQGSTFTVRLPLARSPQPPSLQPTGRAQPPRADRRHRVLIADDNADAADTLALLLGLEGHTTVIARDGVEAVALAQTFDPHLAILDLGMPHVDGLEAARRIRALPGGPAMRLVALTGWGQDHDKLRTRQAGFDAHLVKPIDPAQLAEMLRDCDAALGRVPGG